MVVVKKSPKKKYFDKFIDLSEFIPIHLINPRLKRYISDISNISDFSQVCVCDNQFKDFKKKHNDLKLIIDFRLINNFRYVNKHIEKINSRLKNKSMFIGRVMPYSAVRKNIFKKYPFGLSHIIYFYDLIFKRVFPKLSFTKKIYFFLTGGKNRVISKAEIFGRLYSCGFTVESEILIGDYLYFKAIKKKEPDFDKNPTYGLFINLERLGKNGKKIKVYKLRTMHPYAEYLQDYIYKRNSLSDTGKIRNDFRISTEAKFMRKIWIDELPMIYNIFKGEIKIFGVRPLSEYYFNLYSKELKNERIKHKPGFIPPYYVDLPKTFEEIMDSELKYFKLYNQNPILTDLKYLLRALNNVFIRGVRSS